MHVTFKFNVSLCFIVLEFVENNSIIYGNHSLEIDFWYVDKKNRRKQQQIHKSTS